jgi:hypothetical protein
MFYLLVFNLIQCLVRCDNIERIIVPQGQSFSFDCQDDESVYFGRQLNHWSEIHQDDYNLNFQYLTNEKILRITSDAAQIEHIGFYACRRATWTSTAMASIYQLILAGNDDTFVVDCICRLSMYSDVHSFYWNYICHGPLGSCERLDDPIDEYLTTFKVTDHTDVELFCCASMTTFEQIDIRMNQVGDHHSHIDVQRKHELDGRSVLCAHQRTQFIRKPYQTSQSFTCELLIDDQRLSILSSMILIQGYLVENVYFILIRTFYNMILDASVSNRHEYTSWNHRDRPIFAMLNTARSKRIFNIGVSFHCV